MTVVKVSTSRRGGGKSMQIGGGSAIHRIFFRGVVDVGWGVPYFIRYKPFPLPDARLPGVYKGRPVLLWGHHGPACSIRPLPIRCPYHDAFPHREWFHIREVLPPVGG